jgi:hypothetical protein
MDYDHFFTNPLMRQMAEDAGICTPRGRSGNHSLSPLDMQSYGLQNSLPPARLISVAAPQPVKPVKVLNVNAPQQHENRSLATVHISVRDAVTPGRTAALATNQRLILIVEWQTGNAGGMAFVDGTNGTMFTMSAAQVVNVKATFLSNRADSVTGEPTPLTLGQDKFIEASAQWGSTTFQPAYMSGPILNLTGLVESVKLPIPPQAARAVMFTDAPGTTFTLNMYDASGTILLYSTDFNRQEEGRKIPVVAGAETYSLEASANCNALAVFELWL